jgi:hypothetical protein
MHLEVLPSAVAVRIRREELTREEQGDESGKFRAVLASNRETLPELLEVASAGGLRAQSRMHLGRHSWCRECARAATRDWRERNRERENAERRAAYREANPLPERPCVVCGRPFAKRPDALVCSPNCRWRRKRLGAKARVVG